MKDLVIGFLLCLLCVLAILYGLELKRLDAEKMDKHKIIQVNL